MPVFRRWESTIHEAQIFEAKALAYIILRSQMIDLGTIIGMELSTNPYIFWRGNEEALDNSSGWHVDLSFQSLLIGA